MNNWGLGQTSNFSWVKLHVSSVSYDNKFHDKFNVCPNYNSADYIWVDQMNTFCPSEVDRWNDWKSD